jgi:hypothetical protein
VPHSCQNRRKTTVTSGHLRVARAASDLDTCRLTPCVKRPSKQQVVTVERGSGLQDRRLLKGHSEDLRHGPTAESGVYENQGGASGAPRAGLWPWRPRPARPRRLRAGCAIDLSATSTWVSSRSVQPSSQTPNVQLATAASMPPLASLRNRLPPSTVSTAGRYDLAARGGRGSAGAFLAAGDQIAQYLYKKVLSIQHIDRRLEHPGFAHSLLRTTPERRLAQR